jgi:hypothetical protein
MMSDNPPPLPKPEGRTWAYNQWGQGQYEDNDCFTEDQMRAYGQQCRQQALEEAALACRYMRGFTYTQCDLFESAVLALRDKP